MTYDLSIYIPTYNRVGPLVELLNALLPERRENRGFKIEIIVSDNCSTDQTYEVMSRALPLGYADLYLRHGINHGADINILSCMKFSRGRYVWLLCDDDLPAAGAVGKICSILASCDSNDVGLIYLNRSIELMSGEVISPRVVACEEGLEPDLARLLRIVGPELLTGSSLVFKRRDTVGRYASRFGLGSLVSPLTLALDAVDVQPAYLFSEPLVRYREGDKTAWLPHWADIRDNRIPGILTIFCREHGIESFAGTTVKSDF